MSRCEVRDWHRPGGCGEKAIYEVGSADKTFALPACSLHLHSVIDFMLRSGRYVRVKTL